MRVLLLSREPEYKEIMSFLKNQGCEVIFSSEKIDRNSEEYQRGYDYIISFCYKFIIKKDVISDYPNRIINIHNAYVPYGRGIYPNVWCILNRKPKGPTIHFIDEGIDTGDIIARRELEPKLDDTLKTFHARGMVAVVKLFFECWEGIVSGKIKPIKQSALNEESSYHNREESERLMKLFPNNWDTPLVEVEKVGDFLNNEGVYSEKYNSLLDERKNIF